MVWPRLKKCIQGMQIFDLLTTCFHEKWILNFQDFVSNNKEANKTRVWWVKKSSKFGIRFSWKNAVSNSVISKILIHGHDHHKIVFLFNFLFRQASYQEQHEPVSPVKKLTATKVKTPIKMKPRPQGVDFEEIDVRKILKPLSHSKYIKVRKILSYWAVPTCFYEKQIPYARHPKPLLNTSHK